MESNCRLCRHSVKLIFHDALITGENNSQLACKLFGKIYTVDNLGGVGCPDFEFILSRRKNIEQKETDDTPPVRRVVIGIGEKSEKNIK